MNIRAFKEGDLITRSEPMEYAHNGAKDGSYMGDRLEFLGMDEPSKLIFFTDEEDEMGDDKVNSVSFGRDPWDEGWEYYPETMWQKIKARFKKP